LAPLTVLLEILCAFWSPARRRLIWLVVATAVVVTVLTPLTTSAGQWLYDRQPQHSAVLELHAQRGEWMIFFAVALLVVALVQAVQQWLESRSPDKPRKVFAAAVAVLALVVGVTSIVGVVRIGHPGTEAKWGVISE
jgi:hypothetical protein